MPEATEKGVWLAPGGVVAPAGEDDEVALGTDAAATVVPMEPDADGWHWADGSGTGAIPPGPPGEPEGLAGLGRAPAVVPPSASEPLPSEVVCAPAPLV